MKTMSSAYVPVTLGSEQFNTFDTPSFRVVDAQFPALLTLPPHFHEYASLAVILEGSFEGLIAGRRHDCQPCTVLTEPVGERHGNYFQRRGARVLVLQPHNGNSELFQPCNKVFGQVSHFRDLRVTAIARQLALEVRRPDAVSSIAVEGLALEMVAATTRGRLLERLERSVPSWLHRAEELLHSRFLERLQLAEIARETGVHPVHLARVFKARHRISIGRYIRELRLNWAAEQLANSSESVADIALRAEFSDQAHFTRAFRDHTGWTPSLYRRRLRGA